MGICESCNNMNVPKIRCTYLIKDGKETQIINDRHSGDINEDILKKMKILNGNSRENLIFTKKFDKMGLNIIEFIVEERLNNMSYMFNNCSSLIKIEFISLDTSQVTNMRCMFQECSGIEYLDLSNFNTSNVSYMEYMFNQCNKLKQIIGIKSFNTNQVIDMTAMFQGCNEIEYLDLSNFNTSKVTTMKLMFNKCHKLKRIIGIENFNTNNVVKMDAMFLIATNWNI